jgi:hypothetical protein
VGGYCEVIAVGQHGPCHRSVSDIVRNSIVTSDA